MRTLAIAAAFALIGTGAVAQSTMAGPMGGPTTTMSRDHAMMDKSHHRMAAKSSRHCKTWWKHGRKMRTCKTMRHHM